MKIELTTEQAQVLAALINSQIQQNKATVNALDGILIAITESSNKE